MLSPQAKNKPNKYLPVTQTEPENTIDTSKVLSRYRVIASGPFPALCDCTPTINSKQQQQQLLETCVVGGVWWKLEQFCRSQQPSKLWRTHGILLGIYVFLILCLGMLLDGKPLPLDGNETATIPIIKPPDDITTEQTRLMVGLGVLVITALYFMVLLFLGAGLGISQAFRTKLEDLVQEISEQLEPIGLKLALDNSSGGFFATRSRHIYIVLKQRTSLHQLPPVTQEFQKKWMHAKETKASVDSILYDGGQSPSLSNNNSSSTRDPTPVDDWIAGGLMMRLRKDRYKASQCSRLLGLLVLLPIGMVPIFHLLVHSSTAATTDDVGCTTLHNAIVAMAIAGGLTLAFFYLRECLDASALHSVTRAQVKQFSAFAKERHDCVLTYEVSPSEFLPRITKGVIRFQPASKKSKASLAFV